MKAFHLALAASLLAVPAVAQNQSTDTAMTEEKNSGLSGMYKLDDLLGNGVYTVYNDTDYVFGDDDYYEFDPDWEQVGNIANVVVDRDGQMQGLIVSVGGFLGMGDKYVMIEHERLETSANDADEIFFVTNYTEEELESLPEVRGNWF